MPNVIIRPQEGARQQIIDSCPFGAIEETDGRLRVTDACTLCYLCGVIEVIEDDPRPVLDKTEWQGIAVFVECRAGRISPVALELLGKARQLADKAGYAVLAVVVGEGLDGVVEEIRHYSVDKVYVCQHPELEQFRVEPYTTALAQFVQAAKPSVLLFGATPLGRSLAPRLAARLETGLTADCTILDIKPDSDLIQIRPAFGGNVMAQIVTPFTRPQLATVRHKVFKAPDRTAIPQGEVVPLTMDSSALQSGLQVKSVSPRPEAQSISDARRIVVAGRGMGDKRGLELASALATALGATLAGTRPLIEAGLFNHKDQIGLSGRTVAPELIITCGVSGSVQFIAGMQNSECIISINQDSQAPIFNVAHYGVVGDGYEILPELLKHIEKGGADDVLQAIRRA